MDSLRSNQFRAAHTGSRKRQIMEKQRTISTRVREMRIACTFPDSIIPQWYPQLFNEVTVAYHACATKPSVVDLKMLSKPMETLTRRYFEVNGLAPKFTGEPNSLKISSNRDIKQESKKSAVFFSGGKDSVHLALRLLETHDKNDLFAVYVANLNKSETYYEARATKAICDRLGIKHVIVRPVNSIRLNRANHNISLRGQMIFTLSLPYLIREKIKHIYFGNFFSFDEIHPPMFGEHKEALGYLNSWLEPFGLNYEFHPHFVKQNIEIYEEMIGKWRDILDMTSSCYTQMNFREHRFAHFKAKVPDIPVYAGCGTCIKCLRINSAILLFDKFAKEAPLDQQEYLMNHFRNWSDRYPEDESFQDHFARLNARYTQK